MPITSCFKLITKVVTTIFQGCFMVVQVVFFFRIAADIVGAL